MGAYTFHETNANGTLDVEVFTPGGISQWYDVGNTVYYALLMPIAVVGNLLSLIVVGIILKNRRRYKCIPDVLLGALAACDLASALLVHPFTLSAMVQRVSPWPFGHVACLFQSFAINFYFQESFFVQVLLTVDRYFAVSKPLYYHTLCTFKRVLLALTLVTVFSFCMNSLSLFFGRNQMHVLATVPICLPNWRIHSIFRFIEMSVMGPVFVTGISIFVACNASLIKILIEYQRKISEYKYFSETINQLEKASAVHHNGLPKGDIENENNCQTDKIYAKNNQTKFNENQDKINDGLSSQIIGIQGTDKHSENNSGHIISSGEEKKIKDDNINNIHTDIVINITDEKENGHIDSHNSEVDVQSTDGNLCDKHLKDEFLLQAIDSSSRKKQSCSEQNLLSPPKRSIDLAARSYSHPATGSRWLGLSLNSNKGNGNKQNGNKCALSGEIEMVVSTIEDSIEKCMHDEGKLQYLYKHLTKLARHLSRSARRRQRELLFVKLVLLSATVYVLLWIPYLVSCYFR